MPSDGPTDLGTTQPSALGGTADQRVGNYRLLHKVGEGGMGEVFLAEQEKPIRRRVALKLIKAGMDTKQMIARFESERQALALMDHPSIAKVFDADSTSEGRPYFAMEYVKGEPITRYCDRHRLTTRERIELFMQVCEGVQHAHQKGIIHRDIKASNVLVSIQEEKPVPKIIDFGVAKATEHRLTEKTFYTQLGALIGTPEYMSPEQAEMTGLDVDTRTDVYSLGVLLYELLTGVLPFDSAELRKLSFDEIRRKVREEEPSRPSTRVSTLSGERATSLCTTHRIELPALKRQLKGDLDWITMNALEKDRTRRYAAPLEMAADLRRHLDHEPVLVSPPSTVYRARKFIRRHRVGVGVSAMMAVTLVGFVVTMAIQAGRISGERDRANREAATAGEIAGFMTDLFGVSDPGEARGNTITVREILDRGAVRIDSELSEQPEMQAGLMNTMGEVYRKLGLYSPAEDLLGKALRIRKQELGEGHPDTLAAMHDLAILYKHQGRYVEAESLYVDTIEGRRRVLGEDDPATLASMNNLAVLYTTQGRHAEAELLQLRIVEGFRRALGDDHEDTLAAVSNLALIYQNQARYDKAEPLYREAVETQTRVLGEDHPNTLWSRNNLANVYERTGRYEQAEHLHLGTLEMRRRVLGEDHPQTMWSKNNLAIVYEGQERYDEAERLFLQTLEGFERKEGEDHPDTVWTLEALIHLFGVSDQPDKARSHIARLLSIRQEAALRSGAGPAEKNGYAWLLLTCEPADLRDPQAALSLAIEVNDVTGHADPSFLDTLSLAYHRTGQVEKAIETQRKAISLLPDEKTPFRADLEARLAEFEASRAVTSE